MSVTIYTTPSCPYCRQAKEYLRARRIPFTEKDVMADRRAAQEMVQRSGQSAVPVLDINGEVIVGFDRARIDHALAQGAAGRPRLGAAVASAAQVATKYGLGIRQGAYVGRVTPGTPAERGGIRTGDVILNLAGQGVNSADDVERIMGRLAGGQHVPVLVWRDGRQVRLELPF